MTPSNLQIPPQFASAFGVGAPKAVFVPKGAKKWVSLIFGVLLIGGGGIGFLVGAYFTYLNINQYGPATTTRQLQEILLPTACVTAVLVLIGLGSLWSTYTNWRKAAVVYAEGLGYSDHKGVRTVRWEQFSSMTSAVTKHYRNGIYVGTTHIYTLLDRDGKKVLLNDSFPKVEDLANAVRQNIFPHLYKASADAYNAGQTVQFGPVSINKANGIQMQKKAYRWDEVKEVSIQQGVLKVAKKDGGWFSGANVMVASIPNLDVLLSIIDQVVGIKAK